MKGKNERISAFLQIWANWHFYRGLSLKAEVVEGLIPINLVPNDKMKADHPINAPKEAFGYCHRGSKLAKTAMVKKNWAYFAFLLFLVGDNNILGNFRRLIYNILLVYDKVKTVKPIDVPSGASFCRYRGSKLAKIAIVTEIEHFWHFGHFQKEIDMI